MAKTEVNLCIDDKLAISLEDKWLKKIVKTSLEAANFSPPVEAGLFITDSETVQELNRKYRRKDKPTDVLSFHTQQHTEQKDAEPAFVTAPDGIQHLGEVVISYPQAVIQAKQQRHGVKKELTILIIHGILHLLGYDHEQTKEGKIMRTKEEEILEKMEQ